MLSFTRDSVHTSDHSKQNEIEEIRQMKKKSKKRKEATNISVIHMEGERKNERGRKKILFSVKSIFGWPKEIINTAIYWKKRFGIQGASWPVSEW